MRIRREDARPAFRVNQTPSTRMRSQKNNRTVAVLLAAGHTRETDTSIAPECRAHNCRTGGRAFAEQDLRSFRSSNYWPMRTMIEYTRSRRKY